MTNSICTHRQRLFCRKQQEPVARTVLVTPLYPTWSRGTAVLQPPTTSSSTLMVDRPQTPCGTLMLTSNGHREGNNQPWDVKDATWHIKLTFTTNTVGKTTHVNELTHLRCCPQVLERTGSSPSLRDAEPKTCSRLAKGLMSPASALTLAQGSQP